MGFVRVGIDTGGTFTDVAVLQNGTLTVAKVPTTTRDPSMGIASSIREYVGADGPLDILAHGTTIGTNALLQGQLPQTALVTTAGTQDVIEIGRQKRLKLYELDVRKPVSPVPARYRFEVAERVGPDGAVIESLDDSSIERLLRSLEAAVRNGVRAVAIGLLHSYVNPSHERMLMEAIQYHFGEAVVVTRSSDVLPEFREYERFMATVANASLIPIVAPYVARLRSRVEDEACMVLRNLYVTQSDGTLLGADDVARLPVRTVLSGPSSGVIGAKALMDRIGMLDYITVDVGGTSTDICVVEHGEPLVRSEATVGDFVLRTPALDVHSIGAGGGSIVTVDVGGHLKVGPASAGAEPGPAAYGKGGAHPTVTDACVILGYLTAEHPLAGNLHLDVEAAQQALVPLARQLDLSIEDAAAGVLLVEASNMERAVRRLVAGRGIDVREFALVAFGGAGPMICGHVGRALGNCEGIIPPHPGLVSAMGLLVADLSRVFTETHRLPLEEQGWGEGRSMLESLASHASEWYRSTGLPPEDLRMSLSVDARYVGQNYEIRISVDEPATTSAATLRQRFHERHSDVYRFTLDRPVEFVTWRVVATAVLSKYEPELPEPASTRQEPTPTSRIYVDGAWQEARVLSREKLAAGDIVPGPAVIHQMDSTTVLLPGQVAHVDGYANLRIGKPHGSDCR